MPSYNPPVGKLGFDPHADQRGRIIGSNVAIIALTIIFVALRLLSRKLSRAGFWVSDYLLMVYMRLTSAKTVGRSSICRSSGELPCSIESAIGFSDVA